MPAPQIRTSTRMTYGLGLRKIFIFRLDGARHLRRSERTERPSLKPSRQRADTRRPCGPNARAWRASNGSCKIAGQCRNGATRFATRSENRPGLKMQEVPGFIV